MHSLDLKTLAAHRISTDGFRSKRCEELRARITLDRMSIQKQNQDIKSR